MSGSFSGDYDPVPAIIKERTTTKSDAGEVTGTWSNFASGVYIRFAKQSAYEAPQHQSTVAIGMSIIRCRYNTLTNRIRPEMRIHHRSAVYGILGINRIDYSTGEIEFQCQEEQVVVG